MKNKEKQEKELMIIDSNDPYKKLYEIIKTLKNFLTLCQNESLSFIQLLKDQQLPKNQLEQISEDQLEQILKLEKILKDQLEKISDIPDKKEVFYYLNTLENTLLLLKNTVPENLKQPFNLLLSQVKSGISSSLAYNASQSNHIHISSP